MSEPPPIILAIRRRLEELEAEVKKLATTLGRHEGRIGTLMEQSAKLQEATDQLEARVIDNETDPYRTHR